MSRSPCVLTVVLASNSPEKLAEFYAFAIQGKIESNKLLDYFCVSNSNGMQIEIFRPSIRKKWLKGGRSFALCLRQAPSLSPLLEIQDWSLILASKGARVVEGPKELSFGVEAWLEDPERNQFLILVPKES